MGYRTRILSRIAPPPLPDSAHEALAPTDKACNNKPALDWPCIAFGSQVVMSQWIKNLTIARKFVLVFVLSLGMVALPTMLALRGQYELLIAAQAEAAGTRPSGAVLRLVQLTQQHRGLSAMALAGNAEAGPKRLAKQSEVEAALTESVAAVQTLANDKLNTQIKAIADEWRSLSGSVAASSLKGPQSFARHTALISQQMQALEGIVDVSTLILDPEASTYYLITAAFNHAPNLTESLGQMRARGAAILTKGSATTEDLVRLATLADMSSMQASSVSTALQHAQNSDASLKAKLQQTAEKAQTAAAAVLKMAEQQIVKAEAMTMPPGEYFKQLTAAIDAQFEMIDISFKLLDQALAARVAAAQRAMVLVTASIIGFAALTLMVIVAVSRSIKTAIDRALQVAQTVASGDLGSVIVVDSRDETGLLLQALKTMNEGLVTMVGQVRISSDSIATASSQIASGNTDLATRTEQQASNLQQTASAMEELTATVQRNADTAREANALAGGAREAATKGGQVVHEVVDTMRAITDSSRRISDIIGVIDGIAFQTNILALNAAVEAARAGEQGRGFAVVASEVRTLAQRSAAAAREIKQLIGQSVDTVEAGSRLVGDAGASMNDIVQQVQRVAQLIEEISTSSSEQDSGIAATSRSVHELDRMTQANAALVEESAAAAESLNRQATSLSDLVRVFKLDHHSA
jgi:methyl-accepting chemotaxis protein